MAAQFSDDAYNKFLDTSERAGTLIGNWFEERSIREATGEGRSVPQRHIPRSGLLTDWTKVPSTGPRKQDNTFERIYGPKVFLKGVPSAKYIGAGEEDLTGEKPIADTLQAEGRVARIGPRELEARAARREAAELDTQEEEAELERKANERSFETTSGLHFGKPDETQAERASHLRKSYKLEILHGPPADRSIALRNAGLDIQNNVHYSNLEGVTHARMSLVDSRLRNDMKVSAHGGHNAFGRNSQFSKPITEFDRGLAKDDELENMYQGLKKTSPVQTFGGAAPRAAAFAHIPSLTALKDTIHRQITEVWGQYGYVTLRHQLYDCSDHEGFASVPDVIKMFRESLGLTEDAASDKELDVFLNQLVTMKRGAVRISALMLSLRPSLSQQAKARAIEAFKALGPEDGVASLGAWLKHLTDEEFKGIIVNAFGALDESSADGIPLNEQTFVELLSDLAPLIDITPLLPA
mmetsp:Transcript_7079/g.12183  ORF Transcript_7079/g.12183 Transcript_7079/m.12183 type:complete len:467 (-) Transcript_7079:92-1492(-)